MSGFVIGRLIAIAGDVACVGLCVLVFLNPSLGVWPCAVGVGVCVATEVVGRLVGWRIDRKRGRDHARTR